MGDRFEYLLAKYLDRTITPDEKSEFFMFIREDDRYCNFLNDRIAQELDEKSAYSGSKNEDLYQEILRKNGIKTEKRNLKPLWIACTGIAAAILLLILIRLPETYSSKTLLSSKLSNDSSVIFRTAGQISLPDGSIVILREESELTGFFRNGKFSREVHLEGEAYFDIARDTEKKFVVKSGTVTTTVLGTSFHIRSRGEETEVVVTRGLVEVSGAQKSFGKLSAREHIKIKSDIVTTNLLPEEEMALLSMGMLPLVFEETPLGEVLERLGEKFGVSIILANPSLAQCRISGRFVNGEGLEEILDLICTMRRSTHSRAGDTITIAGGSTCK